MNNTNPSTLFGGTWKQLTADAYLKIVTSGASETPKGQTNHKIPVDSMPSHTPAQNAHYHKIWSTNANHSNNYWSNNAVAINNPNCKSIGGCELNQTVADNSVRYTAQGYKITKPETATNQNTGGASILSWIRWCLRLVSHRINISLKEV